MNLRQYMLLAACIWTCGRTADAAEPAGAAAPASVRLITLGTGGGVNTRLQRSASANAIVVGDSVYLVDVGDRVLQQLTAAGLQLSQVRAIFITHHHQDHTAGLMPLLGVRWMTSVKGSLQVHGPAGLSAVARGFSEAMRPSVAIGIGKTADPLPDVTMKEIGAPGLIFADANLRVIAVENTHFTSLPVAADKKPKSYAFRVETAAGSVVFTGDSAVSDAVTKLAQGADLLVSEVISVEEVMRQIDSGSRGAPLSAQARAAAEKRLTNDHIAPAQVGEMAQRAGVGRVVLSHLAPGRDGEDAEKLYGDGVRQVFKGPVTVARDLQVFTVSRTTP